MHLTWIVIAMIVVAPLTCWALCEMELCRRPIASGIEVSYHRPTREWRCKRDGRLLFSHADRTAVEEWLDSLEL